MPTVFDYFDAIDQSRSTRVRQLSTLRTLCTRDHPKVIHDELLKSLIVSCYAHWEGFYNDCARTFIEAAIASEKSAREVSANLLVGVLAGSVNRLRDRNHSRAAQLEFVKALNFDAGFDKFDKSCVLARSNLNFDAVSYNYEVMGFDISTLNPFRLKLNKELVGYRHSIAHGDEVELSDVDVANHIGLVYDLLSLVSDEFQQRILAIET